MIPMILLSLSRAWAGGVGATVAVGGDWFGGWLDGAGAGEVGTVARAAVHWTAGSFVVGPVYQGTRRDYYLVDPDWDLAARAVLGDLHLHGLGGVIGMPAWLESPSVRFGGHVDVLAELYPDTTDPTTYQELVDWEGGGPSIEPGTLVIRPGAGLDLGVALTERRPGPELYLGGDASYRTGGFGLGFALLGGVRILGAD